MGRPSQSHRFDVVERPPQPNIAADDAHVRTHALAQPVTTVIVRLNGHRHAALGRQRRPHLLLCSGQGIGRALPGDDAFDHRVAGQAVGTVQAGARHLADGPQTRQLGAAVAIGHHAPTRVVGSWHDRNGLTRDVQADGATFLLNAGKEVGHTVWPLVGNVEVHAVPGAPLHFGVDGAGHHVARREFGPGVVPQHEALTTGQQQAPTFTTHRLRDQKGIRLWVVQGGGMELDELQTRHLTARAPRRRQTATCGHRRVGGVGKHLSEPTCGQHHLRRQPFGDLPALDVEQSGARTPFLGTRPGAQQVNQGMVLEQRHFGAVVHRCAQHGLHRGTGGVVHMRHTPQAAPTFAREVQFVTLHADGHAQVVQPTNGRRCPDKNLSGGAFVAGACPSHQGVCHMGRR